MKPISARHKYALSPPDPGPACPAHPALRAPPTAAVGRHSRAARRSCNFAPKRPHLAARRAGDKSCGAAAGGRAAKELMENSEKSELLPHHPLSLHCPGTWAQRLLRRDTNCSDMWHPPCSPPFLAGWRTISAFLF
ncbi:uncharacterized protein LOC116457553 [Hylobates moloch]|uniref:uncharacterized protein LOC116457553 n=1 Tax=Hylobates moloch TaxID=81572 RepID=UPI0013634438|nr:uncharacterized protein LOC116457553 [Hylobates moloch]